MKIRITQISRVEKWIDLDVDDPQPYLEGDFEAPSSTDSRWQDHWDLQNEEVKVL